MPITESRKVRRQRLLSGISAYSQVRWVKSVPAPWCAIRMVLSLPPKHERTIEEWSDEEIERAYENMGKLGLIYESHPFYDRIKQQAKERGLV